MSKPITMTCQLFDIKTRRDGGGRVQLEFGAESMHAVAELMRLNAMGHTNLGVAIVPVGIDYNQKPEGRHNHEDVDPETGEILL